MALTTYEDFKAAVNECSGKVNIIHRQQSTTPQLVAGWMLAGTSTGIAPTTGAVPTNGQLGSIQHVNASGSNVMRMVGASSSPGRQVFFLYDRLSHMGGLNSTLLTSQTVNTAALTRYTNGVGVHAFIHVYGQIGATVTYATVVYTNQSDVGSRTGYVNLGGTGAREVDRFISIGLQEGDTGVKSVESLTMAATTGTAGNFGVVLVKPLALWAVMEPHNGISDIVTGLMGQAPVIQNDACLCVGVQQEGANTLHAGCTPILYESTT